MRSGRILEKSKISNHALLPLRGATNMKGSAPCRRPLPKILKNSIENQPLKKEQKVMPKGLPEGPPIGSKSAKRTQNDSQDPFREVLWKTRGKSVATRGPQEAQRTKTKKLPNPIEPARSKRTFPFDNKNWKGRRKCLHMWPLGRPFPSQFAPFGSQGLFNSSEVLVTWPLGKSIFFTP